jgi:hypothetical protein
MKTIGIKSLLIGILLASTILLGVAAVVPKDTGNGNTPPIDKTMPWDDKQEWEVKGTTIIGIKPPTGFQPFAMHNDIVLH